MENNEILENDVYEKMSEKYITKDDDIEPVASGSTIKINGDHHISDQLLQNDEDSCTSTNSSSSHNLVIDQPEEGGNNAGYESDEGAKRTQKAISSNPLKRKLSTHESESPEYKLAHLMGKSTQLSTKSISKTPPKIYLESKSDNNDNRKAAISSETSEKILKCATTSEHKGENEDHFQEYAKYLRLKPTVNYKCFKCYNNSFETLAHLRSHQKVCLFKENHRHSSQDGNPNDVYFSSSSNPLFDKTLIPTSDQIQARLEKQYIDTKTTAKAKKKVFLCAACGTYYENWNLFLHMREVHRRHICLYCVGMFPTAERLTLHLEMKHDLEQNHFESHEKLLRASRDTCYLMCCICEHIFTEHEEFQDHNCSDLISPCTHCGQKGRHSTNCRSLQSDRSSKEKSKKKSKAKDNNSFEKRAESITTNQPGTDSVRLVSDNFCDTKKTRGESRNHWNFKLNGCPTETSTKQHEDSIKVGEYTSSVKHSNLESELQTQALNLSNSSCFSDEIQTCNFAAGSNIQENDIILQNPSHKPSQKEEVGKNDCPRNNIFKEDNDRSAIQDRQIYQNTCPNSQKTKKDNAHSPTQEISEHRSNSSHNSSQSEGSSVHQTTDAGIETPPNSVEVSQKEEEEKPLFVPKFKIKIPKEYQTPIESEHSSTESDEDQDPSANGADMTEDEVQDSVKQKGGEISNFENNQLQQEYSAEDDVAKLATEVNEKTDLKNVVSDDSNNMELENATTSEETEKVVPSDGIEVASEDVLTIELLLEQPIDRISTVEFLRICLKSTYPICLYCNHARRIAVNGHSLALHMIAQHRFAATVDSITAEELRPPTIVMKLKSSLPDLADIFFNMEKYCSTEKDIFYPYEKIFECFLCRFETRIHKELYLHNRKMHLKTAILCFMCRANFFSYSEILCHMCPGMPNKCVIFDIKFRCCLCDIDQIPSAFRLMVHLRKKHFACDVCLEDCQDQSRLSSHVWKHKLHHLCYRCGIAYRNKPDITKHLFWKHGTESVLCKRCLQKRWPHVYHFCVPPPSFVCEVCNIAFSKAMFLKVHKRLHSGDAPYPCTEDDCDKKFISRKLLLKHVAEHTEESDIKPTEEIKNEVEMKDEAKVEEVKQENITEEEPKKDVESSKKKKKKAKKEQEQNIDDIMNLPAPNLSESDSSDDSDADKPKQEILSPQVPKVMLSPPSDVGEDEKESNPAPMMDIWENFKSFQASRNKSKNEDSQESDIIPITPILHVTQSDHDYCMMYKPFNKDDKNDKLDSSTENKDDLDTSTKDMLSPVKKQKSARKRPKSGSDSSSSNSSSSSDSSCSCGSNCSCSSSSGSASDSSSSTSDSSTSAGRRRIAAKRAAKKEKRSRNKSENSSKANMSDLVDVVTTDTKPQDNINFNSIILETDLETDESDTDEDFYDEHPQKLATQMLAEKRKQLMMQTCLSPSHNFDIVENSRPSTPSLPEEALKEKKVKIKKKKREKRTSKSGSIPIFKLNIPSILGTGTVSETFTAQVAQETAAPVVDIVSQPSPVSDVQNLPLPVPQVQVPQSRTSTPIPAPIAPRNRLSTGSSSDADATLKRSKRARRPNKFYGYSSDDDSIATNITGASAFKPTPPPNLTWRKEDLPAPSKSLSTKSSKSPGNALKKNTPTNTPPLPPIPPIIIRPSAILQSRMSAIDHAALQKPPIVEPMRVPPVPVHHIQPPPQYYPSSRESMESESSDEDRLHIPVTTPYNVQRQLNPVITAPKQTSLPVLTQRIPPALLPNPDLSRLQYFQRNNIRWPIRPPAGARPPREGESVYCYCRCPYDEVSEMIACDGDDCMIEWFHFECVGIMVPPKGKWFCPECRPKYPHEMVESYENT